MTKATAQNNLLNITVTAERLVSVFADDRRIRHCCVGWSQMAGDRTGDVTSRGLGLCRLPVPARGDLGGLGGTCGTACPTGTLRNCSPSAASPLITSPSTAGCSGSLRSSSRPQDRAATLLATGGSSTRPTLRFRGGGPTLYRVADQHGQVIDVLLSAKRDLAAARRFFTRALRAGTVPVEVTTDRASVYPRVLDELVPSAMHTVERHAKSLGSSWAGYSAQRTPCREDAVLRLRAR
jgi:DDE superfamily endonuclease